MAKEFDEDIRITGALVGDGLHDILNVRLATPRQLAFLEQDTVGIIDKYGVVIGYLPLAGGRTSGPVLAPNMTGIVSLTPGRVVPPGEPAGTTIARYTGIGEEVDKYYTPQPPLCYDAGHLQGYRPTTPQGEWTNPANWFVNLKVSKGWTNWDDGLEKLNTLGGDIAIFITDGTPTGFNFDQTGDPFNTVAFNSGRGDALAQTNARPIPKADAIKASRHLLVIGVGPDMIDTDPQHADVMTRLTSISGPRQAVVSAAGKELGARTPLDLDLLLIERWEDVPSILADLGINAQTLGTKHYSIMVDASDSVRAAHGVELVKEGLIRFITWIAPTDSLISLGQFGTCAEIFCRGRKPSNDAGEIPIALTVWEGDPTP